LHLVDPFFFQVVIPVRFQDLARFLQIDLCALSVVSLTKKYPR